MTDDDYNPDDADDLADEEMFGHAEGRRLVESMLDHATLDEDTGEVLVEGPWGWKDETLVRRFSSLEELERELVPLVEEIIAARMPFEGGASVSDIDGSDIVSDAIAGSEVGRAFDRVAQEEEERDDEQGKNKYRAAVRLFCEDLAKQIAEDPTFLDNLEWRDLERMLAEVFEKLGFGVTLTPPSKDGGKDIILETNDRASRKMFLVEVKHWRTGKRVGEGPLRDFVSVVLREKATAGVFVSSSGYSSGAYEALSVVERRNLILQGRDKVYTLCKTYTLAQAGLWRRPEDLSDVLQN